MKSTHSRLIRFRVTLGMLSIAAGTSAAFAQGSPRSKAWPGFRGARVNGTSTEKGVFSDRDGFSLKISWRKTIGSGYSGVAIAQQNVVTMFSTGESDVVIAFDEATGEERWRFEIGPTNVGHDGSHTGPIATPLIDLSRVFCLSPQGRLFALDISSGSLIWSHDLVTDYEAVKPHYGFSSSPMMQAGVLIVQIGSKNGAIAGFEPATGKQLWAVGEDEIQYQTPIPLTLYGQRQIIAVGSKKLFGVQALKGKLLWEYEHGGEGAIGAGSMTPISVGNDRLLLAYKNGSSSVVQLNAKDGHVEGEQVWDSRSIRNSYNVPVYHDGFVYAYSSRFLTCVDAATGESRWRSRQPGDGFTILVDGHLVILTKHGSVHVAKATPEGYVESAELHVFDDMAWSPPSFANGHIVVRGLDQIARIEIQSGTLADKPKSSASIVHGSSPFLVFLAQADAAADKTAVIDRFMRETKSFPIVEADQVHFVYRGPGDDLAVASDLFGARQERSMLRMEGTDFFYYSTKLESDARANYMFIRDFEEHLTDSRNPRTTTTQVYGKEMEMNFGPERMEMSWFAMAKWKAPDYLDTPDASRKGRLEPHSIESQLMSTEVKFDVYLPAQYDKTTERYPVAYVHGGQAARERGELPKALDNLIGRRVAPVIVVFINHDPPRGPNKYAQMCAEELVSFIDANFRTIASRDARAYIGMGFPGLTAFSCAFDKPIVVSKVGCLSPFMFGSMRKGVDTLIDAYDEGAMRTYIDWGKYDLRNPDEAWDMSVSINDFARHLEKKGHTVIGGEVHDGTGWSSWRNRTDRLFTALFPIP